MIGGAALAGTAVLTAALWQGLTLRRYALHTDKLSAPVRLLLLTDLWAAPILQPVPPEEVRSRCLFLNQLTRPFGFELMDEELIQQLESYWRA